MEPKSENKNSNTPRDNFRKVLAVNSKINSTLNIDELLTVIMETAAEVMQAEVASLLLLDEKTQELIFRVALGHKGSELIEKFRVKVGEGIAGFVAKNGKALIVNDTENDPRFAQRFDKGTGFKSKAIIACPMNAKGRLIGVLEAINPKGRAGFSEDDLELFEIFSDQAAIAVENAKMHAAILKQEKAKQELAIAREIQQNFLPNLSKMRLPINIAAKNIPALDVSGDFYDVVFLSENKIGMLIADVSGKGVPAALFMVNAISNFRFLAPRYQDPSKLLEILNDILVQNSTRGMFITMMYLVFDRSTRILESASAGHHPMLRRKASGEISELESSSGIPLGFIAGSGYLQCQIQVSPGDTFFLYTDGITEARDKRGQEYSLARLKDCILTECPSAEQSLEKIFQDLESFSRDVSQHDDMTMLALRIPE